MAAHEQYDALLAKFQQLTTERAATGRGEKYNELTRERNKVRDQLQKLKAQFSDQVIPTEQLILENNAILGPVIDEQQTTQQGMMK